MMNKNQSNMWENDASLVPDDKAAKDLKLDMLFNFVLSNSTFEPKYWLGPTDLTQYNIWLKTKSQ